ncbi:phospholipid carrier-dependent glycosyltransferase [Arsenicicoccus sp. MKL-02]|uniref:Phospholipid carrier-dependent glycosyltransferase n=1 Tax=Arsenicicoccus cauae TaxID=2663847 RepID=A0A6I3I363_9MICO|nr:glycosyltransferase family 39 protein [Arsenicicoccus cauae]MTB70604.1 phospholipid carrier-dependent glycosyltransferase [Arsenicicoccus cauae]
MTTTPSLLRRRRWPRAASVAAPGAETATGATAWAPDGIPQGSSTDPTSPAGDTVTAGSPRSAEAAPRWARPALWGLLALTAALYLWNLSSSGYANEFYAAAVKSGTQDLTAWVFGSLDSANSITVDKPPVALWLMVLSCRIFGFSSVAMLLPQALAGVGTVALTAASVRRVSGHVAGLVAGLLVALTPVAALMFRFNNPDALLVLLMTAAAYFVVRAIETTRGRAALRWMVACGAAIGLAFLTKMLQGLLVVPAFALAYLVAARFPLRTRVVHLLAAGLAMVAGAGWFVALVSLWPASSRPYIGGSTNDTLWELALGYNGLGRILGGEGNGGGGGGGGGMFGGATGITRMFGSAFGAEISWLLPTALVLLVAGLVAAGRAARTSTARASLILWGGWLVVSALILSFMEGTVHPYYSVALAPAVAAVIAIGGRLAWDRRSSLAWRVVLGGAVALAGVWSVYLLHVHADAWLPALRWVALAVTALGVMGFVALGGEQRFRRAAAVALLVGSLGGLAGTTAWTVATVAQGHTGSTPSSGPAVAGASGPTGGAPSGTGGAPGGTGGAVGQAPTGQASQAGQAGQAGQRSTSSATSSSTGDVTTLLRSAGTTWSAAVVGDQTAAGYILSTDTAVMAIGGWSGTDASPTLAEFQQYVADGQIHYFVDGGRSGGPGAGDSSSSASQITAWVKAHWTATTVGGTTVYDLTSAAG